MSQGSTIQSYLKTLQLQQKWQMRQEGLLLEQKHSSSSVVSDMLEKQQDSGNSAKRSTIAAKLKAGKRLNPSELAWLRDNDPTLYQNAKRIEWSRMEQRNALRRCRTKEDARRTHNGSIQSVACAAVTAVREATTVSDRMSAMECSQMHQAALRDEFSQFRCTRQWGRLPQYKVKKKQRSFGRLV